MTEKSDASIWDALRADVWREHDGFRYKYVITGLLIQRNLRALIIMRLCQAAATSRSVLRWMLPVLRLLHGIATHNAGIDLSWRTDIGAGLALMHGRGLVVNPNARIGKNVTLFHGVTIGQRDRIARNGERLTEYPVLEDEVWVGPYATIVGGITIGRGSRIAAGAFVTEDIPPYSIVQGNPATIVKRNCVPDVSHPAPV